VGSESESDTNNMMRQFKRLVTVLTEPCSEHTNAHTDRITTTCFIMFFTTRLKQAAKQATWFSGKKDTGHLQLHPAFWSCRRRPSCSSSRGSRGSTRRSRSSRSSTEPWRCMRRGSPSPRGASAHGRSRTSPAPMERCTSCLTWWWWTTQLMTKGRGGAATGQGFFRFYPVLFCSLGRKEWWRGQHL